MTVQVIYIGDVECPQTQDFAYTTIADVDIYTLKCLLPPGSGLDKTLTAVKNIREVGKRHMVHNDYTPRMDVDPQTYAVKADGQLLVCEPADILPMAQRYFLF